MAQIYISICKRELGIILSYESDGVSLLIDKGSSPRIEQLINRDLIPLSQSFLGRTMKVELKVIAATGNTNNTFTPATPAEQS